MSAMDADAERGLRSRLDTVEVMLEQLRRDDDAALAALGHELERQAAALRAELAELRAARDAR